MKRSERLEAVTVCIDHADFLRETIKWNHSHFDRHIIVTSPDDKETLDVCHQYNLEHLKTEDAHRFGKPFNKGRVIERALCLLSADSWRIHLDSDIALPQGFRTLCQTADLDPSFIYGADRINVYGWEKWKYLISTGFMHHSTDYHTRVNVPYNFEVGVRYAHPVWGYIPVGYLQIFHSSQDETMGERVKQYPSFHNTACRSDVQFALKWDRHKRGLIPELFVAHLMSEHAKLGANWNGRTTRRFGPEPKNLPGQKGAS